MRAAMLDFLALALALKTLRSLALLAGRLMDLAPVLRLLPILASALLPRASPILVCALWSCLFLCVPLVSAVCCDSCRYCR